MLGSDGLKHTTHWLFPELHWWHSVMLYTKRFFEDSTAVIISVKQENCGHLFSYISKFMYELRTVIRWKVYIYWGSKDTSP